MEDIRENRLNVYSELRAILLEADEDHLGVALIKPGCSRYERMKVADFYCRVV